METVPHIVFHSVLNYATNGKKRLKSVVSWERVSKKFSSKLMTQFWKNLQSITLFCFPSDLKPFQMAIEWESYNSFDMRALKSFQHRVGNSMILFQNVPARFLLPTGFADLVPTPRTISLGPRQNLNDPELLQMLKKSGNFIEILNLYITNPTISPTFIQALLMLKALKQLAIYSYTVKGTRRAIFRKAFYAQLSKISLQCLMLSSRDSPGYGSVFDEELFTMLETKRVQCLHLKSFNHYVARWLTNSRLHERAQITNLCIVNDHFGYNPGEEENQTAPLFHTYADYNLLFPKLQFLCIGICFLHFDDKQLDSMLLCYYLNNTFNIKLRLTIRLFHKLKRIEFQRFDWVSTKLKSLQAEVKFIRKSNVNARITITSKDGNISSEIIVCFDKFDVATVRVKTDVIHSSKIQECVDMLHFGNSPRCLCADN